MHDTNGLLEVDVRSIMVQSDAMDRFHNHVGIVLSSSCEGDEGKLDGNMTMFIDEQGFLYMHLTFGNDCSVLHPIAPDEWMPVYAA